MTEWYQNYLKSDHWQRTRAKRLLMCDIRDVPPGILCDHEDCGLYVPLKFIDVHHLSYDRLGREGMDDLLPRCRSCHAALHGFPRPYWWTALKKQGYTQVTEQQIKHYRHIRSIGEVMFECLQFVDKRLVEELAKITP